MLTDERLVAFLWTSDRGRARSFYEGVLGLKCLGENDYLLSFDCGPARVSLVKSDGPVTPPHGTAMGWSVADLRATVRELKSRGVSFEQGPNSDGDGIWSPEPGLGVAWFFDPDQNRLSVSGPC